MKLKHNKKRNTFFLFETLVRELTKSIVKNDTKRKIFISSLIKESFNKKSPLYKELYLYKTLLESKDLTPSTAEKLLTETKRQFDMLDRDKIFEEQSNVINKINKHLSRDVFSNFVPSYRNVATVYQIFNNDMAPKKKILMEGQIVHWMSSGPEHENSNQIPSDALLFKTFINKFNLSYSSGLLIEQKTLLNKYITSFSDNGIELKIFLNEEIDRLKKQIKRITLKEAANSLANRKINNILLLIEGFKKKEIDLKMIEKILKIQSLSAEVSISGN